MHDHMQQNILEQHEKERVSNTVRKLINYRYAGHHMQTNKVSLRKFGRDRGHHKVSSLQKYTSLTNTYDHHRHRKSLEVPSFHIIQDGP